MAQRCNASIRDPSLPLTAFCQKDRNHSGPHRNEDETHVISWESGGVPSAVAKGEDPLALEPYAPEPTRPSIAPQMYELQLAFEGLREVALKAAHHLRNLPATTEGSDIEMAEELERAAEGS